MDSLTEPGGIEPPEPADNRRTISLADQVRVQLVSRTGAMASVAAYLTEGRMKVVIRMTGDGDVDLDPLRRDVSEMLSRFGHTDAIVEFQPARQHKAR